MKKHFKNDCSNCHEYPYECEECSSEAKALVNRKISHRIKKVPYKYKCVINNN